MICALYGDWEDCILYTYMLGSHMISPSVVCFHHSLCNRKVVSSLFHFALGCYTKPRDMCNINISESSMLLPP
jgi:hypothetical protein